MEIMFKKKENEKKVIKQKNSRTMKIGLSVKFIDNQTKVTQISQFELRIHKDSNWKMLK
ncbi:conjugal transfer protein [Clostridioides difficile]|nr:conjugal transfer protein [Clostridioides difficile]